MTEAIKVFTLIAILIEKMINIVCVFEESGGCVDV